MIARKIIYSGNIDLKSALAVYDITRKIEITGEVEYISKDNSVELRLEGDPSMIKLVQHQVERKIPGAIKNKQVTLLPFHNYQTVNFIQ